jgi:hypothetical protein
MLRGKPGTRRKVIDVMSRAQAKKKPSEEGLKISARGA